MTQVLPIPDDDSLLAMWEPRMFTIYPGQTIGRFNYFRAKYLPSVWFSLEVIS